MIAFGLLLGVVGGYYFPTYATTQCENNNCVTNAPGPANYVVAAVSAGTFLLGLALVYLAWRRNTIRM